MAGSKNNTKEFKLPKYLKLAKGTMWFDNLGENCSNITLINTTTNFIGRGCITDDEWDTFLEEGYLPSKKVPKDSNKNESTEHGQYGHVEIEDKSYFETTKIHNAKLGNIITAYKTGVLIDFDPKKEVKAEKERELKRQFIFKKDGDIVFNGDNKHMFDKLNNSNHEDLIKFIETSPINAKGNLMDLYDYEMQGYNRLNRPRATVLDAIKKRLNAFGPGMSAITIEKNED